MMNSQVRKIVLLIIPILIGCTAEEENNTELLPPVAEQTPPPSSTFSGNESPRLRASLKMVLLTVDEFEGQDEDRVFINILLGLPIPSDIYTTHTTYFELIPNSNVALLILREYGWTIWEANGFYPINWTFQYTLNDNSITIEGLANMTLTQCDPVQNNLGTSRFHFQGNLDNTTKNLFKGVYTWEETNGISSCIRVSGKMEVSQGSNF